MLINVLDDYGGDIQGAINAAADGDRIYIPATGMLYHAPVGGYAISKRLEIFGDGIGNHNESAFSPYDPPVTGTAIIANRLAITDPSQGALIADDAVFTISAPLSFVHIHDLKIVGQGAQIVATSADAMWFSGLPPAIGCDASDGICDALRFERVMVFMHSGHGFSLDGGVASINGITMFDCNTSSCFGCGLFIASSTDVSLFAGEHIGNRLKGVWLTNVETPRLFGVWIEANEHDGSDANNDPQLRIENCVGFVVHGCHFEEFNQNANALTAVSVSGSSGGSIDGNAFVNRETDVPSTRGVYLYGGSRAIQVGRNDYANVDTIVDLVATGGAGPSPTNCIVVPQCVREGPGYINVVDADGNGNYVYLPTTLTSNVGAGILLPRTAGLSSIDTTVSYRGLVAFDSSNPGGAAGPANRLSVFTGSSATPTAPETRGMGWQRLVGKIGQDVDLAGQTAAVSGYLMDAGGSVRLPKGLYRVSATLAITTVGNPITVYVLIGWTDANGARTARVADELLATAAGSTAGVITLESEDNHVITYQTVMSGAIGVGAYQLRMRLEAI